VPATAANLGPGFDCLALALDLLHEVEIDPEEEPGFSVRGEGSGELPAGPDNLMARSMRYVARLVGRDLPPLAVLCTNRIPLERGLGSSAAAVVAGVALADRLLEAGLSADELLDAAVNIEGHPDNVAGALRGGLVVAYRSGDEWRAESLAPAPNLSPVILVPVDVRLSTSEARRVLPNQVRLEDAAFNAGRTALTVMALTGRIDLLGVALQDRLHQPSRLPLVPRVRSVFEDLTERGVPVCVSGAGPSLLAFETPNASVPDPGEGWRVLRVGPRLSGADVVEA
jgi:homoserine kinase